MVLLSRLKRLLTLIKNGSLSSACAFVRKPNAQRPMTSKVKHWKRLQPKILKLNCCHNEISEEKICKFSLLVYYYFFFMLTHKCPVSCSSLPFCSCSPTVGLCTRSWFQTFVWVFQHWRLGLIRFCYVSIGVHFPKTTRGFFLEPKGRAKHRKDN